MDEAESTAPQQAIVLTIRPSSGSTFTTAISTDSTVLQLKEKLATADLPAASIRLVYSGRVLKDDDQLSVYCKRSLHTHQIFFCVRVCGVLCVMMALVQDCCPLRKCEQGMAMQQDKSIFCCLSLSLCVRMPCTAFRTLPLLKTRSCLSLSNNNNTTTPFLGFVLPFFFFLLVLNS